MLLPTDGKTHLSFPFNKEALPVLKNKEKPDKVRRIICQVDKDYVGAHDTFSKKLFFVVWLEEEVYCAFYLSYVSKVQIF